MRVAFRLARVGVAVGGGARSIGRSRGPVFRPQRPSQTAIGRASLLLPQVFVLITLKEIRFLKLDDHSRKPREKKL